MFRADDLGRLQTIYAPRLWHGYPVCIAFVGLFLFLFVTSPMKPIPLWRSATVFLVTAATLALILMGREYNHPVFASDPEAGTVAIHSWALGSYIPIAAAIALLLVTSAEFRGRVSQAAQRDSCTS